MTDLAQSAESRAPRWLRDIVARSSTLEERLAFAPGLPRQGDDKQAKRLLDAWSRLGTNASATHFSRRLAWDDLTRDGLARRLLPPAAEAITGIPDWAVTLEDCIATAPAFVGRTDPLAPAADAAGAPFEEAYWPFVACAAQTLSARLGPLRELVADDAHLALEGELLSWLAFVGAPALYVRFAAFRRQRRRLGGVPGGRPTYVEFINGLHDGGWPGVFAEMPVLGRLLGLATAQWIDTTAELVGALAEDLPQLAATFGAGRSLGLVVAARGGLSDRHRHGRTVHRLRFESGIELVYKPRPTGMETRFAELLRWIADRDPALCLRHPAVLPCGDRGWVAAVDPRPCRTPEEVDDFFRRSGMLMALVQALGGTDCHYENVVADGPWPLLIDLETLFHHRSVIELDEAAELLQESVAGTGFLPKWIVAGDSTAYDTSALGGTHAQATPYTALRWEGLNSDAMHPQSVHTSTAPAANLAGLADRAARPAEHLARIAAGFSAIHDFLRRHREALLAPDGVLAGIGEVPVRCILRHTNLYGSLLEHSFAAELMCDGLLRSAHLDQLARTWTGGRERPPFWPTLAAERRALEDMDIPVFDAWPDSTGLHADGKTWNGLLREPSLARAQARLAAMDGDDLRYQLRLIDAAFAASQPVPPPAGDFAAASGTAARLESTALELARSICAESIHPAGRGGRWTLFTCHPASGRFELGLMGEGLYEGRAGVALSLAAVAACADDDGLRRWVRELLVDIQAAVARRPPAGLDLAGGVSGIAYALGLSGQFLGCRETVGAAGALLKTLTPAALASTECHDLLTGSAGLIHATLALERLSGDPALLELARYAAGHLEAVSRPTAHGGLVWANAGAEVCFGMAHGQSGIAYALHRLGRRIRDPRLDDLAAAAFAAEDRLAGLPAGTWPVSGRNPAVLCKWCYGAPGIALARLACGAAASDSPVAQALAETRAGALAEVDHLCCGTLGRCETLLQAAAASGVAEPLERARDWAGQVVQRRGDCGGFRLFGSSALSHAGLFQGQSGIAYQLLRLSRPERLPSLLLFES